MTIESVTTIQMVFNPLKGESQAEMASSPSVASVPTVADAMDGSDPRALAFPDTIQYIKG